MTENGQGSRFKPAHETFEASIDAILGVREEDWPYFDSQEATRRGVVMMQHCEVRKQDHIPEIDIERIVSKLLKAVCRFGGPWPVQIINFLSYRLGGDDKVAELVTEIDGWEVVWTPELEGSERTIMIVPEAMVPECCYILETTAEAERQRRRDAERARRFSLGQVGKLIRSLVNPHRNSRGELRIEQAMRSVFDETRGGDLDLAARFRPDPRTNRPKDDSCGLDTEDGGHLADEAANSGRVSKPADTQGAIPV